MIRGSKVPGAVILAALTVGCSIPRTPIDSPMTSPFGIRWMGGLLPGIHRGIDLQAAPGTPVGAMMKGTVRFAGWMNGFGNVVWLDHTGDVISIYAHLSEIQVRAGEPIEGGAILGLSGSSGNVTGPHLHFEVWKRGWPVDPARFLGF